MEWGGGGGEGEAIEGREKGERTRISRGRDIVQGGIKAIIRKRGRTGISINTASDRNKELEGGGRRERERNGR